MDTLALIMQELKKLPNEQLVEVLREIEHMTSELEGKQYHTTTRLPTGDSR